MFMEGVGLFGPAPWVCIGVRAQHAVFFGGLTLWQPSPLAWCAPAHAWLDAMELLFLGPRLIHIISAEYGFRSHTCRDSFMLVR